MPWLNHMISVCPGGEQPILLQFTHSYRCAKVFHQVESLATSILVARLSAPTTSAPSNSWGQSLSLIYWGQALKETLPPGRASWPHRKLLTLTDCARLYSSDHWTHLGTKQAFYIKTHAGTWLILGSSPMCRLMGSTNMQMACWALPKMQPACVGYWVCPCRPRPHTPPLLCALGAGCKMGSSCPLASSWVWPVEGTRQSRGNLYFQLQPPPHHSPQYYLPRALHHPFSGPCPSHTLSIVISLNSPQLPPSVSSVQVRNSFKSQLGQRRWLV